MNMRQIQCRKGMSHAIMALYTCLAVFAAVGGDNTRDALKSLERDIKKRVTTLDLARARPYKGGFQVDGPEVFVDTGTNGIAGANWSVPVRQTRALPLWISASGRVLKTIGGGEVCIYVDVTYVDGGHLWGQKAFFTSRPSEEWFRRTVQLIPDRPVSSISVYLMARNGKGQVVRFRDPRVEVADTADEMMIFDTVPVVVTEPIRQPGFLVRDVAARDGFCRISEGAKGLTLTDRVTRRSEAVFHDVTLSDTRGGDRAVTLVWAQPITIDTSARWFDSPRSERSFADAKGEFYEMQPSTAGRGGYSRWPFIALSTGGRGVAIGIDPRLLGFFRLGANPSLSLAYISYDMALVPEKRTARMGFVTFSFDARDGWRGALEAYQRLFPDLNAVLQRHQGNWMAFRKISSVQGWEDFGFAIKEGHDEIAWDDAHGITTFRYTEPSTWWMSLRGKDDKGQPTMDQCVERAKALAAGADPRRIGYAKAWKTCAIKDEDGNWCGRILDTPWCNGIVWNLNCAPGLGPDCEFEAKLGEPEFSRRYVGKFPEGLDGEYIDSSEMYVTAELDFNRANFAGMSTPLVFASGSLRPAVFKGMMSYEYARAIHAKVRALGRRVMANSTPHRWCWLAPFLDVLGTETNWHPNEGVWKPIGDREMMYFRTLCGGKPFCFLQNTDFNTFTYEMCERYMQRSLAYGMYPSFFSPAASSSSHYFSTPSYYNRDRPLFKKYLPLCRLVGEAGWRAVNRLSATDDEQVITEQFGDDFATVFNLSAAERRVRVRSLQGRAADELVAGGEWCFTYGVETVTLPPETVRVLRFRH